MQVAACGKGAGALRENAGGSVQSQILIARHGKGVGTQPDGFRIDLQASRQSRGRCERQGIDGISKSHLRCPDGDGLTRGFITTQTASDKSQAFEARAAEDAAAVQIDAPVALEREVPGL
jgi:hypothetical protein